MNYLKLLVVLLFSFSFASAEAQSGGYDFFNAGVGVSGYGIPIFAGVDVTVEDRITVGGMLTAQRYSDRYVWNTTQVKWVHYVFGVSANANYHFVEPGEVFDVYAGISAGYFFRVSRLKNTIDGYTDGYLGDGRDGIGFGLQLGGRYILDNGIILYSEVGGSTVLSSWRVGVSFPFP